MIVSLNKIYFIGVPPEVTYLAGTDTVVESSSPDAMYVKMKKPKTATPEQPLKSLAIVFDNRGTILQGVINYTDLPDKEAQKRLMDAVQRLKDNAKEGNKPKNG